MPIGHHKLIAMGMALACISSVELSVARKADAISVIRAGADAQIGNFGPGEGTLVNNLADYNDPLLSGSAAARNLLSTTILTDPFISNVEAAINTINTNPLGAGLLSWTFPTLGTVTANLTTTGTVTYRTSNRFGGGATSPTGYLEACVQPGLNFICTLGSAVNTSTLRFTFTDLTQPPVYGFGFNLTDPNDTSDLVLELDFKNPNGVIETISGTLSQIPLSAVTVTNGDTGVLTQALTFNPGYSFPASGDPNPFGVGPNPIGDYDLSGSRVFLGGFAANPFSDGRITEVRITINRNGGGTDVFGFDDFFIVTGTQVPSPSAAAALLPFAALLRLRKRYQA